MRGKSDYNHYAPPQKITFFEGLKEDLAWVAGAAVVAGACWLFIGDDYADLLVVPVLAAIYLAVKSLWRRVTRTPRRRRRIGLKTIFWSVAAGVAISVVLGFVWDSFRGPSTDSEAEDTPDWMVSAYRNSPLAPPCSSTEDIDYLETQMEILEQVAPLLKRLTGLFTDPPGGILDLEDEEWQRQISVLLLDMEELGESLRNYHPVPESLERTHNAMTGIGGNITNQAYTLRSVLQATLDGNRLSALGHMEKYRRFSEAYEESMYVVLDRMNEECDLDTETPKERANVDPIF